MFYPFSYIRNLRISKDFFGTIEIMLATVQLSAHLTVGDIIVGGGTILLAFFTWRLARQAEHEVRASDQAIRMTRESLESQDAPFVILVNKDDGSILKISKSNISEVRYEFWNLGKGPAIITSFNLVDWQGHKLLEELAEEIPIGVLEKLSFGSPIAWAENLADHIRQENNLILHIQYRDANGIPYQSISDVDIISNEFRCRNFQRMKLHD